MNSIINQGNLSFEAARKKVNAAKQRTESLKQTNEWLNKLGSKDITEANTDIRSQAALFLQVIDDVANIMNTQVKEEKKQKTYPYELSDYEISEQGVQTVEEAANRIETIAQSNTAFQPYQISEQIKAFNPHSIPVAQTQSNDDLSDFAGRITNAIKTGEKYQPKQSEALTIDNLKLPTGGGPWGTMGRLSINEGKVRTNVWIEDRKGVMVARDTTSAMDIPNLVDVPGKGAMLTGITHYWLDNEFKELAEKLDMNDHRIPNTQKVDPNIMVVNKVKPLPVEVVLRRHITGSAYKAYSKENLRNFGSHKLPDGIKKNDGLNSIIVDPTIKGRDQDLRISDRVAGNLVGHDDWQKVKEVATKLFEAAEKKANEKGLMLVDTKFEFGKTADGKIVLIDEVLTPDSSRYWSIDDYQEAIQDKRDPKDYSKEPLRNWVKLRDQELEASGESVAELKKNKVAYKDALGVVPERIVTTLAQRYAAIYNALTGKEFNVDLQGHGDVNSRILANLKQAKLLK